MKPSSPTEVKLAWGRSACRLSPSSASAEDCTALFTLLPWGAHSWLIALELAVQHECNRREKPDECLGPWMPYLFHAICRQILSISCFSRFYCYLHPFFCTFSKSVCRKLNPSPVSVFLGWPERQSESCWKGWCPFVRVSFRSDLPYCNTFFRCKSEKTFTSHVCLSLRNADTMLL